MEKKIRIHFFPRDATRVRILSFSRGAALTLLGTALTLCLFGFWLALSGALREAPQRKQEREHMERQNRVLREKVRGLRGEAEVLAGGMDSLESSRIRAVLATGLEGRERKRSEETGGLLRIFPPLGAGKPLTSETLARSLGQARRTGRFFDSALFVLRRNADLAGRLPTAFPMEPEALLIRPFGLERDPFTGRKGLHAGLDFSLRPGAPVFAAGSGRVIAAGHDPLWGNYVRLMHTDRIETFYAHLQKTLVRAGASVTRGRELGILGQSGVATGPHLHFEMRIDGERVDPSRYLLPSERRAAREFR